MKRDLNNWIAEGLYLLREALWRVYSPLTRRLPIVVTTRKAQAAAERNAFDLGREADHYWPQSRKSASLS